MTLSMVTRLATASLPELTVPLRARCSWDLRTAGVRLQSLGSTHAWSRAEPSRYESVVMDMARNSP